MQGGDDSLVALLPLAAGLVLAVGAAVAHWTDPGLPVSWWQRPAVLLVVAAALVALALVLLAT